MIRKLMMITIVFLSVPVAAQANELAISFNDDTAELAFRAQLADYDRGRSVLSIRGLYNDKKETDLASAAFDVLGPIANTGLEMGAGVRAYYVNTGVNNDELAAGGLGAVIRYVLPTTLRISFLGMVSYCPEVLTAMDGENLLENHVRASIEIAPRATAFVSYTNIEADFEDKGERTIDDSFRVGLTLGF